MHWLDTTYIVHYFISIFIRRTDKYGFSQCCYRYCTANKYFVFVRINATKQKLKKMLLVIEELRG